MTSSPRRYKVAQFECGDHVLQRYAVGVTVGTIVEAWEVEDEYAYRVQFEDGSADVLPEHELTKSK